ncbi:fumarylacetoacetate hydrolase family protein [Vitiosangium sp. GDMCC 1.1324]|uniref:fumarylacetoacetate hydrolase family protein n=1 Tax=Vitiosangium sp. (strain GDMCC 1.1324) TaxID=2138576 RepID=UPI000D339869|nr:fumarylacetoacetate hydrolase family protein [Vitiosangium sp. GDMCC 1.1324]PTL84060.1 2-keto-4-pentenoate hydratase [Vitiosangium sp. GDMCC 1.1324]
MKLASLNVGRDGRLVVVSKDLSRQADASAVAPTLQAALDNWEHCAPLLRSLSERMERGQLAGEPFDPARCAAPLPRAYQWADGSAYVNHVELVRKARKAELPATFWTDPLMYQGGSDGFLGPRQPIPLADEAWGCDMEGEVVVVTRDVPLGATREQALGAIVLVGLVNDVSLRNLIPDELAKGFGFFQSKPASAFSPVFVTPDELGTAWRDGKLHRRLEVFLDGQPFGRADAGVDMTFDFGTLVAHAAKTRTLCAGTLIGSGTVSNRGPDGGPGKAVSEGGAGYSCIAELRMVETLQSGAPRTPFLKRGNRVRIEMRDEAGTIFGAIDQVVGDESGTPAPRA